MPAIASVPPRSSAAHRHRHEIADRREQDRRVQRFGRQRRTRRRRTPRRVRARAVAAAADRVRTCTVAPSCDRHLGARDAPKRRTRRCRGGRPRASTTRTQRAVPDDPGAQQRRGLVVVVLVGERIGVALVHDRHLCVAAVGVPAGVAGSGAEVLVAPQAEPARAAGMPQPRDADPVADGEPRRAVARARRHADHLVPGHDAAAGAAAGRPRRGAGRCGTHRRRSRRHGSRPERESGRDAGRARAGARQWDRECPRPTPTRRPQLSRGERRRNLFARDELGQRPGRLGSGRRHEGSGTGSTTSPRPRASSHHRAPPQGRHRAPDRRRPTRRHRTRSRRR